MIDFLREILLTTLGVLTAFGLLNLAAVLLRKPWRFGWYRRD